MKPFLGTDLTLNKKNEQINGEEFLVAKPSLATTQSLERSSEEAEKTFEKSKLPLPIRIGHWLCGIVGVIVVIGILKALGGEDSVSLAQAYQNASWLFWLGGGCLLVWGILKVISVKKQKAVLESEESVSLFAKLDGNCDAIYSELSVPSYAKEVDVLSFLYKVKDGNIKVCEKGMQIAPYINLVFKVFADDEKLYLVDLDGKYAFELSSVKAIRKVKKPIRILEWNKDEPYNKEPYKQYKLSEDEFGCVLCKYYYILEIEHNGEAWGIYIPCYELPTFEELTGLKAQE